MMIYPFRKANPILVIKTSWISARKFFLNKHLLSVNRLLCLCLRVLYLRDVEIISKIGLNESKSVQEKRLYLPLSKRPSGRLHDTTLSVPFGKCVDMSWRRHTGEFSMPQHLSVSSWSALRDEKHRKTAVASDLLY